MSDTDWDRAHRAFDAAPAGPRTYASVVLETEFVGVEMLRRPDAIEMVIALRPPRPSSSFQIADATTMAIPDNFEIVHGANVDITKHASELRWNCIETMLRKDIEEGRLDRTRMIEFLDKTLDDQTREALALRLMAKVEAVPR